MNVFSVCLAPKHALRREFALGLEVTLRLIARLAEFKYGRGPFLPALDAGARVGAVENDRLAVFAQDRRGLRDEPIGVGVLVNSIGGKQHLHARL